MGYIGNWIRKQEVFSVPGMLFAAWAAPRPALPHSASIILIL